MVQDWFVHLDADGKVGRCHDRMRPCYRHRRPAQVEMARQIQRENHGGSVYLCPVGILWECAQLNDAALGVLIRHNCTQLV